MADIHCFYVSEGLLTANHTKRIGGSIWEFLWLISHETKMAGRVLNGSPITVSRIAQELGESVRTARRNLNNLSKHGYVTRKRSHSGEIYSYSIAHSKKWRIHWAEAATEDKNGRADKNGRGISTPIDKLRPEMAAPAAKIGRAYKEDRQLDNIYIRDSTCTKCKGTGLVLRMVSSELNPQTEREDWVQCECKRS